MPDVPFGVTAELSRIASHLIALATFGRDMGAWTPLLYCYREREVILDLLEESVVFLTAGNIEQVLRTESWPDTARHLANLYLGSIGAERIGEDPLNLVGLSERADLFADVLLQLLPQFFGRFVISDGDESGDRGRAHAMGRHLHGV